MATRGMVAITTCTKPGFERSARNSTIRMALANRWFARVFFGLIERWYTSRAERPKESRKAPQLRLKRWREVASKRSLDGRFLVF